MSLVITRNLHDEFTLSIPPSDEERVVTVTVVRINKNKIRLAIDAPLDVAVSRPDVKTKGAS